MILKMKTETGWSFTEVKHALTYTLNKIANVTIKEGNPSPTECVMSVWQKAEDEPLCIITSDEAYLLNDNGKTIERIN